MLILGAVLILIPKNNSAQSPLKYEALKLGFPDNNAVITEIKEEMMIDIKDSGLAMTGLNSFEIVYLNDRVKDLAGKEIYCSDFCEVSNIKAQTITSDKNGGRVMMVRDFFKKDDFGKGIFYGSGKKIEFLFPGVTEGARSFVTYKQKIRDPHFLTPFYFGSYAPVVSSEYSITFPKEVKIKAKLYGSDTSNIKFTVTHKNKYTTYTWKANLVPEYDFEEDAPPYSSFAPHVIISIEEYIYDGKTIKVLGDIDDLYSWYSTLTAKVNVKEDSVLKAVVDSLCKGVSDDKEKARRIFYWVQDKIKYVAFEAGLEGFVPRNAALVCSRRYGDCKDMASILTNMMKFAGIKTHLTWIGTRDIPYSYYDVPLPITDNHMIACAEIHGEKLFFDATGRCTPYGFPTAMIQGKEALVGSPEGHWEVIKIPIVEQEKNRMTDTINVAIENKIMKGTGKAVFSGYRKLDVYYRKFNKSKDEADDAIKSFISKGNNKFNVTNFSYTGLEDRDQDLTINYEYTLPDYAQVVNDAIYINLNLNKSYKDNEINLVKRKNDLESEYKYMSSYVTKLEIPKGYSIKYLPPNNSFKDDEFGYDITYIQKGDFIYCDKKIYMNHLLLKKSKFETWNKMTKQLSKDYKEVVVLTNSK